MPRLILPDEFPYYPVNVRFGTSIGGRVKMANPECIPVNAKEPTPFETKLFKGTVMLCIKDAPGETNPWAEGERFAPKKRKVVVTVQGKFKEALNYSDLQCGLVWARPLQNLPWPFILNPLQAAICAFSSGTEADLKAQNQPHFVNNMLAGVDTLHVREAEDPRFDMRAAITPENAEWESAQKRMKDAAKQTKASKGTPWGEGKWDTDREYTFDFFGDKIDLAQFVVTIPGFPNIELAKYFNGQPFPFIAKTVTGEVLWHFEIWHAQLFTVPGAHPGAEFSPAQSDTASDAGNASGTMSARSLSARSQRNGGSITGSRSFPESTGVLSVRGAPSFASCAGFTDRTERLPLPFGQSYDYASDAPISDVGMFTPIHTPGEVGLWGEGTPRSPPPGRKGRKGSILNAQPSTPSAWNLQRGRGRSQSKKTKRGLGMLHLQDRWSHWDDHLAGSGYPRPHDSLCASLVLLFVIGCLAFVGICYADDIWPRMKTALQTWPKSGQLWGLSAACVGVVLAVAYIIGKLTELIKATDIVDLKFGKWEALQSFLALLLAVPEELVFRSMIIPIATEGFRNKGFTRGHDDYLAELATNQLNVKLNDTLLWVFLSVFMYVSYLPLMATTVFPMGYPTLLDPRLLAIATVVGFGCALAYLLTTSIWAPVMVNALTTTAWLLGMGGMKRFRRVRIQLPPSARRAAGHGPVPFLPLQQANDIASAMTDSGEESE